MILPRTMYKQEVAKIIFPDSSTSVSAMQRLRKEIRRNRKLKENLYPNGINEQLHHFTRKQILLLIEYYDLTKEELNK